MEIAFSFGFSFSFPLFLFVLLTSRKGVEVSELDSIDLPPLSLFPFPSSSPFILSRTLDEEI